MVFDQAQSPRLGQRTAVESTYVRMFAGGEIPEAAWPGQLIYRTDDQILQIYNGDAWEDVTGGDLGQLTFVGPTPPIAQHVGDVWFNSADGNRMYVAHSVGADQITDGEWELVSAAPPPVTPTTHIYVQDTPPGALDVPPPHDNDWWFETPQKKQYYYASGAPGTHWIIVQDTGIPQAIRSTVTEYAVSSSETLVPSGGWNTATPARPPGQFIWVRTTTTKNDGTVVVSNPALMTGNTGAQGDPGPQGSQGIPGPQGNTGPPVYTWVKYADTPTTGMSDSPVGKTYMGLAYNKASSTESSLYSDYDWSLIQGPQGNTGVQGPAGANGQPTYTWIKYGDSAAGAGLSDSPTGKTYMGIAYNKTTPAESNTPTDYEWSLIQGPQGIQGSQGIQGPAGANGAPTYTWIKYGTSAAGAGLNDFPAGMTYMGIAYNKSTATESTNPTDYEWSLIQGPQGNQGIQGPTGPNGATTYTWIKYADDINGAGISDSPAGKTYLGIAYNKTTATESGLASDYEWSLIQGPPGTSSSVFEYRLNTANGAPPGTNNVSSNQTTAAATTIIYIDYTPAGQGAIAPLLRNITTNDTLTVQDKVNASQFATYLVTGPMTDVSASHYVSVPVTYQTGGGGLAKNNQQVLLFHQMTGATGPQGPQGATGSQGPQGNQGVAGPPGANGIQYYTWIKYADTPTTGMSDDPTGKKYMGIAYNKTVITESSIYGDYEWSLTQGIQGNQGIQGPIGPNGAPTYTWVKYADTPTTGMSDSPTGKIYMGLAYNKASATESTLYSDYDWSLIQGTGIASVIPYWALVPTGSAAPAKPTAATPPDPPWKSVEPAYAAGNDLYTTSKVLYTDTSYSYTTVAKSSAYAAANAKTSSYYATGTIPNPASTPDLDPSDPSYKPPTLWVALTPAAAGVAAFTTGDLWFQTDESRTWFWSGTVWNEVTDPNSSMALDLANTNAGDILSLSDSVDNVQLTAFAAQDSATTAEGRVSMSDYGPGPDDVTYDQTHFALDPDTGLLVEETTQVPRANGSIWFVRTRPRQNLCTNPSFEDGTTTGWTPGNVSSSVITASPAQDGSKVVQLTNTTTSNHYFQWPLGSAREPVAEGQDVTVAGYTKLITGLGVGIFASIVWYDSGGSVLSAFGVNGDPVDQIVGGVVQDWQQCFVTGTAPAGAATFVARINSPGGNSADVWQLDAMLVENTAELGKYFDGNSFDCSWDDATLANKTTSSMEGSKILQVYELHDGDWVRKFFTDASLDFIDAGKLVGSMTGDVISDNTIEVDKMVVTQCIASEALAAGDLVHVWNNAGVFQLQKACAAPGLNQEVHGFVLEAVPAGQLAKIYHQGYNPYQTNLSPGLQWLSATPGRVAKSPPTATGSLVQRVGFAPSSTVLDFLPAVSIKIT